MELEDLPHLNAALNATSALLLACGYRAIRRGSTKVHARFMISAFVVSTLFLASYITYHYGAGHTTYDGVGWMRAVYLAILLSHIVLALVTVPLAVTVLVLAARRSFDRHRRVARWAFPIWMYVSVTGVAVYVMLYHLR
jgi:uncharacterized membrane protein YozB (DUF420 family)